VGLALLHEGPVTSSLCCKGPLREEFALQGYTPKKCSVIRIEALDGAHSILSEDAKDLPQSPTSMVNYSCA